MLYFRLIMQIDFTKKLLKWNRKQNKRSMPWKDETDPYRIWLSEIILQQTRVEQGLAYYKKFISSFPNHICIWQMLRKKKFSNSGRAWDIIPDAGI